MSDALSITAVAASVVAIVSALVVPLVTVGRTMEKIGHLKEAVDDLKAGGIDQGRRIGSLEARVEGVSQVMDFSQGHRIKPPT